MPDFMAQLIDVLCERMPNADDEITRRVLRLFLRTGWRERRDDAGPWVASGRSASSG